MTSHPSAPQRTHARRGLKALLLLPLLLVLAGCFRLDMGLTLHEDDTVDLSMEVADLTGMMARSDMPCSDLEDVSGAEDMEVTVEEIEEDGNVGCRMVASGAAIDSMTDGGMTIERVDDTFVFEFDGDETGMGDPAALEDMPAGMEPDVSISVTFPGEVIEADGEIDGNTVTWTGLEAFTAGGSATGSATGGGAGGVSTAVWIVLGVVALLAIAALIFFITKRNRDSGTGGGAPYGAHGGPAGPAQAQPGQVPNDPGAGYPAQAGQGQPVGGFGPTDQVPADPGPGYPGQGQPPTADPFTTANADAPVERPELDAPQEPPAQDQQDPDERR